MSTFSKDIIGKIKKEHIPQKSKWTFFIKYFLFFLVFLMALILGALAFSLVLFAIFEFDFELFSHPGVSPFQYMLTVFPLLWLITFFGFFFLASYGVKHIKKGYKLALWKIIGGNILGSILLGLLLFFFGGAGFLDQHTFLGEHRERQHIKFWSHPEQGLLNGIVGNVYKQEKELFVVDSQGKSWKIEGSRLPNHFWEIVADDLQGKKVKVLGNIIAPDTFSAEMILPWHRGGFRGYRMDPEHQEKMRQFHETPEGKMMQRQHEEILKKYNLPISRHAL